MQRQNLRDRYILSIEENFTKSTYSAKTSKTPIYYLINLIYYETFQWNRFTFFIFIGKSIWGLCMPFCSYFQEELDFFVKILIFWSNVQQKHIDTFMLQIGNICSCATHDCSLYILLANILTW